MTPVHVNYLAVLACGVASMVLGFIWYGPLFGKLWMKSVGMNPDMSPEAMKAMQKEAGPGYAAMFIGSLVMAYVLTKVLGHFAVTKIDMNMFKVVGGIWLGFIATTGLGAKFFEKKSWSYYYVTQGFSLVNLLVFGIILTSWK